MKGFPATWADPSDELYKNEKLWPNTIPLAQAYGQDKKREGEMTNYSLCEPSTT